MKVLNFFDQFRAILALKGHLVRPLSDLKRLKIQYFPQFSFLIRI